MANTIKFGNGQWATKEDSILAYNDENANFKPLPFVTSRASTATTVNKSGLLELNFSSKSNNLLENSLCNFVEFPILLTINVTFHHAGGLSL